MKEILMMSLYPLLCAFGITALVGPSFIPWLRKLKFGQEIREEGPSWHQKKSGTPTMGGIMFISGIAVAVISAFLIGLFAGNSGFSMQKSLLALAVSAGFGAVGFADDFIKVVKKRNLGLRALPKFSLQLAFFAAYLVALYAMGELKPQILIPFIGKEFAMPMWLYVIFAMFVVTGTVNAVNLTDGIDGLATSVTIPVSVFFSICAYMMGEGGIASFGLAIAGGLFGFLIYNRHPARVFMGDTGSLFLGGAIAVMAIALEMHIFIVIAGFVYFMEALSVILQVASFKLTGKRIFKMSPIHHHFEMCGWNEVKIVRVFTTVTVILCIIAYIAV